MDLKKNIFNYISLAVGILGLVSSYYFYAQSIKVKEPTFVVSDSEQIFSGNKFGENKRFTLVDNSTNASVNESVYIQKITFWNKGRDAIKSQDILTHLKFDYADTASLIDVSVSESTRKSVVKPELVSLRENDFSFKFALLEENDGFTFTVIYASEAKASPVFTGDFLSVNAVTEGADVEGSDLFMATLKVAVGLFILIGGIALLGYAGESIKWVVKRFMPSISSNFQSLNARYGDKVSTVGSFLLIGLIAVGFIHSVAKDEVNKNLPVMQSVSPLEKKAK